MNKNFTARRFLLTSVVAAALLVAAAASAQPSRYGRTLPEPAYRELRNLARQLDARAQHAADQAAHDRYRLYRRDNTFVRDVSEFARQVNRFDSRLARYRAEPWAVREDVRSLRRSARDIQTRVRQSRWVDEHTMGDWNEMVEILNRMEGVSDGRIDFAPGDGAPPPRGYERDPNARPPQPDRREDLQPRPYERDPNLNPAPAPGPRGNPGSRDPRADQLAALGNELENRAARALATAERAAAENGPYRREFMTSIRDFHAQAAAFRDSIGSGTNNPGQLRAEANRLLDSARQNDQRMRQSNAFREVWPDWQGAMQTLQRINDLLR